MGKNVGKINAAWWRWALFVGALWAQVALATPPNKENAASFSQKQTEYTSVTNMLIPENSKHCKLNDKWLGDNRLDSPSSPCVLQRKLNLNDCLKGSLLKRTQIYLNYTNRSKGIMGFMSKKTISDPQAYGVHESLLQTIKSLYNC